MVIYKFSLVILVLLFLSINAVSTYAQTQVLRKGNAVHYFLEMNEGENILTLDTAAINGNLYYKRKSSFPWFYPNSSGSISYERISGDSAFYILTWQNTDSLVFNFNWKVGTAIYSDTSGDIISERKITKVQVEQYLLPQDTIYYISQYNFNTVTGDTTYWMPEMVRYSKKLGEIERGLWSILIGAKIDGIRYGYVAPYPEEVNFSVDSLYLAEAYDTLNYYLINSSDYDILIDSLFDNNYFGYLTFFIKGDDYFFINFAGKYPNHPLDTLKYPVAAHDSVHIQIYSVDLCPVCRETVQPHYFTDSIHYVMNFRGDDIMSNYRFNKLIPISGYAISSDIRDDPAPRHFSLFQNYPNPFNPVTNIRFRISERTFVRLSIFDILGREISVLVNEEQIAGTYEENFSGADFPSGVYFYTLRAGNFSDTKKFILMK